MYGLCGQNGAVRREELASAMGERTLRAALKNGTLIQIWRGVVVHGSRAMDLRTRAAAAVLAVGGRAVISGPTAVALHGCSAAEHPAVHVTVPYSSSNRSRPGLVVHQRQYDLDDVVDLGGIPTLKLVPAMANFLCEGDKRAAFASLDQALANKDEPTASEFRAKILRCLARRKDRRGLAKAVLLTDLATGKADSPPESWIRLIVVEAGFPIPEPQYAIYSVSGQLIYVLDMAWPDARIALEYDGFAAHEHRRGYDDERDARMAARGWLTIRATVEDLRDPSRILDQLDRAFQERCPAFRRVRVA